MKVSASTLEAIAKVITGDNQKSPYRTKERLINFFSDFPTGITYPSGHPGRFTYTLRELSALNNSDILKKVIEEAVDPKLYGMTPSVKDAVEYLNHYFISEGYILEKVKSVSSDIKLFANDQVYYKLKTTNQNLVDIKNINKLSHEFINEQILKSKQKIFDGDYDGAITNARSLIEAIQEELILKSGHEIPNYNGDLLQLYKSTRKILNLDPSSKDLSETLKQILSGLISINTGMAGLSNKMSDRHSRTYKPNKHHAKLAVNAAFTFCEFLLDTFDYQKTKREGQ